MVLKVSFKHWFRQGYFKFVPSLRKIYYDVVIVGGGVMGSSTAYFLKIKEPSLKVAVIEKDSTVSNRIFVVHLFLCLFVCFFPLFSLLFKVHQSF